MILLHTMHMRAKDGSTQENVGSAVMHLVCNS